MHSAERQGYWRSVQHRGEAALLLLVLVLMHVGHQGYLCTAARVKPVRGSLHLWSKPFFFFLKTPFLPFSDSEHGRTETVWEQLQRVSKLS